MYKIVRKENLAPNIFSMEILAPRVSKVAKPGQFVVAIIDENGERLPFTICDTNPEEGTVEIVVQTIGASTQALSYMQAGEELYTFLGPLGYPSEFIQMDIDELKKQKWVFIGGGLGIAPIYPQVKWLSERGVEVEVILGAKNKDLIILEDKLSKLVKQLHICTDDGSYGFKGMVTDCLKDLVVNQGKKYDQCVCIGPMIMMKFVSIMTKELGIPTTVSMNPIMVDATGMCGACRITVGGQTKFACVDGPEFDAHQIDFDEALRRHQQFRMEENEKKRVLEECEFFGGEKK